MNLIDFLKNNRYNSSLTLIQFYTKCSKFSGPQLPANFISGNSDTSTIFFLSCKPNANFNSVVDTVSKIVTSQTIICKTPILCSGTESNEYQYKSIVILISLSLNSK